MSCIAHAWETTGRLCLVCAFCLVTRVCWIKVSRNYYNCVTCNVCNAMCGVANMSGVCIYWYDQACVPYLFFWQWQKILEAWKLDSKREVQLLDTETSIGGPLSSSTPIRVAFIFSNHCGEEWQGYVNSYLVVVHTNCWWSQVQNTISNICCIYILLIITLWAWAWQ